MRFWIDIEDRDGNKYGDGPVTTAFNWQNIPRIDAAGEFSFSMPAGDPRASIIKYKRIARCRTIIMGSVTDIGAGVIDRIIPKIDTLGNIVLTVSGDDLLRELTGRSVGFLALTDGVGNGVTDSIAQIMSFAPSGWTVDASVGTLEPAGNVYSAFAGETVLNALIKVASLKGEHFRLQPGRKIAWLGSTPQASGIRAVQDGDPIAVESNKDICIVQSLEEVQDTYDVCTRLYPFGAGVGEARLTLAACNRSVPDGYVLNKECNCLINALAEAEFGRIDKYISFKDIAPISNTDLDLQAAANALFDQSFVYLSKHSSAEKSYKLEVLKMDRLVYPGQTIRVVFKRIVDDFVAFSIDRDLYILETTNQIDERGIRTTGLTVATIDRWPENDISALVAEMQEGRAFESHPQLNANAYVVSYREAMDNSKAAQIDFWLGSEILNVNQVMFRFRIDPLRSTVKSVAGQTNTSSSGGSGTQTSSYGGGSNVSSESSLAGHQHYVPQDPPSWTYFNTQGHTHNVSVPNHSHSVDIPSHSHQVTPSISMIYGIYEASSANTLVEDNLVYQVNGGDAIGRAVDIGGGWYEIDLTNLVSSELSRRPLREANQLKVSTATAKSATITGQLVVRTTIQAIAVY